MGDDIMNRRCCMHVVSHHSHTSITTWLSPFFLSALSLTSRSHTRLRSERAQSGKLAENMSPFSVWVSCPPVDLSEVAHQGQSSTRAGTRELVASSTWPGVEQPEAGGGRGCTASSSTLLWAASSLNPQRHCWSLLTIQRSSQASYPTRHLLCGCCECEAERFGWAVHLAVGVTWRWTAGLTTSLSSVLLPWRCHC